VTREQGEPISSLWAWFLLLAGTVPVWALLTYPGWQEWRVGYFPYYNLHAWLRHLPALWHPPYAVGPLPLAVPLPELLASFFVVLGVQPLAALQMVTVLALLVGTVGLFLWQRHWWGPWPAAASALLWLYAPATLSTAYRLGFIGTLWLMALIPWALWRWARPLRIPLWVFLVGGLLAWSPRLVPFPPRWAGWFLVNGLTLATVPVLGPAFRRVHATGPLPVLLVTALAAVLVVPWAQPHYVGYTPPPRPVALFGARDIVLLNTRVEGALRPGSTVRVNAHWQTLRPQPANWTVFLQVLDDRSRIQGQFDALLGGIDHPTGRWRPGEVVNERYILHIAPDAPTSLHLIVGLYDRQTMRRLPTSEGQDHVAIR